MDVLVFSISVCVLGLVYSMQQAKELIREIAKLHESQKKESDQLYQKHYTLIQIYMEECEKIRRQMNELIATCDKMHVEDVDRKH